MQSGCKVLGRRDLESYLLADEILQKLASVVNQPEKGAFLIAEKQRLLNQEVSQGGFPDDVKAIQGPLWQFIRRELALTQRGNTPHAFLSDTMAPLITPDTETYRELEKVIFGEHDRPT